MASTFASHDGTADEASTGTGLHEHKASWGKQNQDYTNWWSKNETITLCMYSKDKYIAEYKNG